MSAGLLSARIRSVRTDSHSQAEAKACCQSDFCQDRLRRVQARSARQTAPPRATRKQISTRPCFPFPVSCLRLVSCVRLAARALYLVGPGSCLISGVLGLLSDASCLLSCGSCLVSRVSCVVSVLSGLMSRMPRVSCLKSRVWRLLSRVLCPLSCVSCVAPCVPFLASRVRV